MAMHGRGFGLSVIGLWLFACGAKSVGEPGDSPWSEPESRERAQDSPSEPEPSKAPGAPGPGVRFDQGDPLGACQAGFLELEHPDEPCNCLVEGVCFDTKAQACACICPRNSSHNTCISAWDCTEDSRTKVSCHAI